MKRIVLVGANGQVASEVALLLHGRSDLEVIPISRTRNGSAFLRSRGVPVFHGSITDATTAQHVLSGADVIANFALASGLGRKAAQANNAIIDATIDHSDPTAQIVFFSTLAVLGNFDATGRRSRSAYGDLKLRNEAHFERAIARARRTGFILRLGHVCGDEQNISHQIRSEIEKGDIALDDPERGSNTTHVVAIAEALLAIAEGRTAKSGRFDCVSEPTWSWRQVYEFEAARLGRIANIQSGRTRLSPRAPFVRRVTAGIIGIVERLGLRVVIERLLPLFPESTVARIKANHSVAAARQEISAMPSAAWEANAATWWPDLPVRNLPGVRDTHAIIDRGSIQRSDRSMPWPADLV